MLQKSHTVKKNLRNTHNNHNISKAYTMTLSLNQDAFDDADTVATTICDDIEEMSIATNENLTQEAKKKKKFNWFGAAYVLVEALFMVGSFLIV